MGEVIQVQPKTVHSTYRGTRYVITYNPDTLEWDWKTHNVITVIQCGSGKLLTTARQMAERMIDKALS